MSNKTSACVTCSFEHAPCITSNRLPLTPTPRRDAGRSSRKRRRQRLIPRRSYCSPAGPRITGRGVRQVRGAPSAFAGAGARPVIDSARCTRSAGARWMGNIRAEVDPMLRSVRDVRIGRSGCEDRKKIQPRKLRQNPIGGWGPMRDLLYLAGEVRDLRTTVGGRPRPARRIA